MTRDRGFTLLEVLVAVVILGASGAACAALLSDALRTEQRLADRERELSAAERVLAATSLLTRADLDVRLGERRVGEFVVRVQRPEPALYRLAVVRAAAPTAVLLVTVVHRPESPSAQMTLP